MNNTRAWWRWFSTSLGVNTAILIFNAILIGVLWNAVFGVVRTERQDAVRAAIDRNDNLANAFEQYTIRTIESADAVVQQLIRAYVLSGRTMDLEELVADFTIDNKAIVGVVLADERGDAKTTAYSGNSARSANLSDREHFKVHIEHDSGRIFIGKPVVGRVAGRWIIPVTRRINKADGTFGGVAMALIEPRRFTDVLHDAKLRPLDVIALVGVDGITRARLSGTTASWGEDIRKSRLFAEQAERPVGNYFARGQRDNVPRFFSYRLLADYQLTATVGAAEADVMAEFFRRRTQYFWTAGFASAVIAGFAALLILALANQRGTAAEVVRSEARFRATFEQAAVGIAHIAADSFHILMVNRKFCDLLGYTQDELIGTDSRNLSPPDDVPVRDAERFRVLTGKIKTSTCERQLLRKNGSSLWVNRSLSLVRDAAGKPKYYISVIEDISERTQAKERLAYLAQHDSLTGLPNRNLFRDRLTLAIARAKRDGQQVALMFLDLDRFKEINDSLGHTAGDEVLQAAAGLLRGSLRDVDTIARLGGDEFTIILEDAATLDRVTAVAEKIKKEFSEPFLIHGREFFLTASIGISLYPHDANDAESLLKTADVAMYQSKKAGRNTYTFYAAEMNAQAGERLHMGALLQHALDRQEFVLHYQPKMETATRRIVGVEALIRWNSRELGIVPPVQFISLAEDTGLIEPVGEWAIKTACTRNKAWQDQGFPPLLMSVSLSPRQFRQKNLVKMIAAVLDESGLAPHLLEFEITESVIMENIHESIATLKAIRSLGVNLAVNDFGTGHSSLGSLAKLPVQTLKIDRSFVIDMTSSPEGLALVSTVINLAHSLKLKVVAEGVETEEQSRLLRLLSCEEMQGFLFSKPVPAEIFEARFLAPAPAPELDGGLCAFPYIPLQ